jgi:hypothetical protein
MALTLNGSTNTIAGLAVGGLPNGSVDAGTLASNSVETAKIAAEAVTNVKQGPGSIVQFVNALPDDLNVRTTTTSASYVDTTLHIDITPTNSTNRIIIGGHVVAYHNTDSREILFNIHNGTSVASDDVATKAWQLWASTFTNSPIYYTQIAGTTSQMTFTVYFKTNGATAGIGFASSPGSTNTNGHQLWAMEVVA